VCFAVCCVAAPADAWNSHGACTKLIISDQDWLKAYDSIPVTAWSYQDVDTQPVGPNFTLQYIEGPVGSTTSAVAILTNYADEPDWNMDADLDLSAFQLLTGGSQGWRHQFYGLGFIRLGVARRAPSTSTTLPARPRRRVTCTGPSGTSPVPCTTYRTAPSRITAYLRLSGSS